MRTFLAAMVLMGCSVPAAIAQELAELRGTRTDSEGLKANTSDGSIVPFLESQPDLFLTQNAEPLETDSTTEEENEAEELETEPQFELPAINVTSGRRERETFRTPATITTIEREEIERQRTGSTTLEDILRSVPGIQFERRGGFFTAEPTLRGGQGGTGAGQTGVLILVNGIRRNNNNGTVNVISDFPLNQVERIEVLRGPASSLYGTDAVDGVINIITRRPSEESFNLEVSGLGGSIERGSNIVLSGTVLPDEGESSTSLLFQFGYLDADSYDDARGDSQRNELEEYSFSGTISQAFNDEQNLELSYLGVRNAIESPIVDEAVPAFETADGVAIFGPPDILPIDITFPKRNTDQFTVTYRHSDLFNSDFTAQFYYTSFERDFTNTFGLSSESSETDLDSLGGTLQFNTQATPDLNLLWGLDIYNDTYRNDDEDADPDATIANLTDPRVVALSPSLANFDEDTDRRPDGEQRVIGLFAQTDWDATPRLKLTGGLRLDVFRQEAFSTELFQQCLVPDFTAGAPSVGPDCGSFAGPGPFAPFIPRFAPGSGQEPQVIDFDGDERNDVVLIPNVGMNWEIIPDLAFYGTYSRGIQQPSLFDLYGGPQSFGVTIGNPDLEAQESDNFDVGLRFDNDRVSTSIAYFRQYYRDQFVNIGEERFGSSLIRFLDNLQSSVVQGVETEVSWEVARDWTLFGNFTWTEGFATSDSPGGEIQDGDRLEEIVPWQLVLGVLYTHPQGSFARLQVRTVSELDDVFEGEGLDTGAFAVVDLDAGFTYKNATFTVGVSNLFNTLYREPFSQFNAPGILATAGVTLTF